MSSSLIANPLSKDGTVHSHGKAAGRVILAIATTGRREVLSETLSRIELQTRCPDLIIVSVAETADVDNECLKSLPCPHQLLMGPKGACFQRNQVVNCLNDDDLNIFVDDDFLMKDSYLQELEQLFLTHRDVVMATGKVLADGITGPEFTHEQGVAFLETDGAPLGREKLETVYNCYGCNMAFRAAPAVQNNLRFDEVLPLYSWLEDVDFSRQMSSYGRIVNSNRLRGVHLGSKRGRTPGVRLGYSQIANPIYLVRKGTMIRRRAWRLMSKNMIANLVKSFRAEPWVDRKGRLKGNILGIIDFLRGRLSPGKILDL